MSGIDHNLKSKLAGRQEKKTFRRLQITRNLIDFTSNDYLGLARTQMHSGFWCDQPESFSGSTGSRLLSGNSELHEDTELFLAGIFKAEKSLIFNSGYNANLGILSCIPAKGDTILYDELSHASLKDGARLSLAQHFSFKHNDLEHLEKKLKIARGNVFVVVESIYSMDGDCCPLKELVPLCKKWGAEIILDEAHSTGILGENGNGMACSMNLQDDIFARIYTFGKAMGVHGACIAGSATLIDYLINFSRPFIYTTALPPHAIHSIQSSFEFLKKNIQLQNVLTKKITLFKSLIEGAGIKSLIPGNTAIQALIVESEIGLLNQNKEKANENNLKQKTTLLAKFLQNEGFDVRPILSPTVKEGSERIRICLHVHNTDNEIKNLVKALNKVLKS